MAERKVRAVCVLIGVVGKAKETVLGSKDWVSVYCCVYLGHVSFYIFYMWVLMDMWCLFLYVCFYMCVLIFA
jgi:hypothetical protein